MEQWLERSKIVPKEDRSYIVQGKDGLWYSSMGRKLYAPKYLHESLLYYFHAGRYRGHFGIRKTQRRLSQWFYWSKQGVDVSNYVGACLPCKRIGPPGKRYLRQVLQRSEPFQLISLDHVGPREWDGRKVSYLVIIDHFSRFVVAKAVSSVSGAETVRVLSEFCVRMFGAPEAVLVDKGPAFTSKPFQTYVYNFLTAELIYCGTGYPQGNAVNKSVHQGIESSIAARRQYDTATNYKEILGDAILAYNSTPHSSTGHSPYYMLFGKDLILPGLQRYREDLSDEMRRARIKDLRTQAMLRAVMGADEGLRLYQDAKLQNGDRVMYYLPVSGREGVKVDDEVNLVKYSPKWSTPVTVTKVNNGSAELDCGLCKHITVPLKLIRKIGRDIPPSLQPLEIGSLRREPARHSTHPHWEKGSGWKRARVKG